MNASTNGTWKLPLAPSHRPTALLILVALAATLMLPAAAVAQPANAQMVTITEIKNPTIVGVVLANRQSDTVRLLGLVEDPTGCFSAGARDRLQQLVGGRRVLLELDPRLRDDQGNLLGYVWLAGSLVNTRLVEEGYMRFDREVRGLRYMVEFEAAEQYARTNGLGGWSDTCQ